MRFLVGVVVGAAAGVVAAVVWSLSVTVKAMEAGEL